MGCIVSILNFAMNESRIYMKILSLFFIYVFFATQTNANCTKLQISRPSKINNRTEYYTPTDEPTVYYNDEEQTIVIEGEGVVDYYDVVISSIGSRQTMCATTVNGISDTIDISTFPAGEYQLTITSSNNNMFHGQFTII